MTNYRQVEENGRRVVLHSISGAAKGLEVYLEDAALYLSETTIKRILYIQK